MRSAEYILTRTPRSSDTYGGTLVALQFYQLLYNQSCKNKQNNLNVVKIISSNVFFVIILKSNPNPLVCVLIRDGDSTVVPFS